MEDAPLVFAAEDGRPEIVVNFGLFSGRDATRAEVERLGQSLLDDVGVVEVVCEQRYTFDRHAEASVYVIRVRPAGRVDTDLLAKVEAWARECIAERRFLSP